MPVPAVHPRLGTLGVAGAAEHVDLCVHEQLRRHLHHLVEQVTARIRLQVLAQQLCSAQCVVDDHRVLPSVPSQVLEGWRGGRRVWGTLSRDYPSYTTLADSTGIRAGQSLFTKKSSGGPELSSTT